MKTAHQYMIALTPDERTPSVKAMVDIILLDAEKDASAQSSDSYDDGYADGRALGYDEGFDNGIKEGYARAQAEFNSSDDVEAKIENGVEGLA